MTSAHVRETSHGAGLRLWPGVVAVLLQWLLRIGIPAVVPDSGFIGVIASLVLALVVLLWWLFFSRAPWSERIGAVVLMIVAVLATPRILHPSIATGMMGMMFVIYVIPVLSLALVAWAVLTRRFSDGVRRATLVATILIACGSFALLRTEGITGAGTSQFAWRWSPSPEERLLAHTRIEPAPPLAVPREQAAPPAPSPEPKHPARAAGPPPEPAPTAATKQEPEAEWPGFRGPKRDSIIRGVRIATDWSSSPPVQIWRRPIGPGWSSFAVRRGFFYTQEQRGEEEIIACYRLTDGEPVWTHRDSARFWESNAGAGPRGTPTLKSGRVYAMGATGIVNALDADTGASIWSRNAAYDTGAKIPGWGFSASPLVVDDVVVIAASGRLIAYDLLSGRPRWSATSKGGGSYSSPQLLTIDDVPQVVMLSAAGAAGYTPADGKLLWEHEWQGTTILQPALAGAGDLLITTGDMSGGVGTRRIAVSHESAGWNAQERWTSAGLKPYFNDLVVHNGHAYGFDGRILSCIDLQDGKRKWKGGRYGNGQLLLLADQDLLLVLSETGELALVSAVPDQFTEIARVPAIEGKTWNHPALVAGTLLVRNGEEMAAFRLALTGR